MRVRNDEGDLTNEALALLLKIVLLGLVVCVAIGGGFAIFRSVTDADAGPRDLSAVDVGFLQDMIDHHTQAIAMSERYLSSNRRGGAASYAAEVIPFQRLEITMMDKWLTRGGFARGANDRQAMGWMGMSTSVATMPGMQTQDTVDAFTAAVGPVADGLFFDVMSDHHRGGVHMAEYAAAHGKNSWVKKFAANMARNQQQEIVEYSQAIKRLASNVPVPPMTIRPDLMSE